MARCNYLAADRFEIAYATKELCRAMCRGLANELKPKPLRKLMKVSAKDKVEQSAKDHHEEIELKGKQRGTMSPGKN